MTTLVIGARGAVGRHVVAGLRAAGKPVRASVRNLANAGLANAGRTDTGRTDTGRTDTGRTDTDSGGADRGGAGPVDGGFGVGVEVVRADLTRLETLPAALDGVRQVFLYAEPSGAADFGKAALVAGVERIVLLSSGSVLVPWAASNPITVEHRLTEEALADSGPEVVPIRPLVLANNARNWASSIRNERTVRLVHPSSVSAPIHERDIAAVALAALSGADPGEVSALLTGAEPLTLRAQVGLIAAAIGAPITVEEIDEARAREMFGVGEPEIVEAILHFVRRGTATDGWYRTDVAERILGRPPVPFATWARDHAPDFR